MTEEMSEPRVSTVREASEKKLCGVPACFVELLYLHYESFIVEKFVNSFHDWVSFSQHRRVFSTLDLASLADEDGYFEDLSSPNEQVEVGVIILF